MKAVILGGSGFIGRELARTMLRKGWEVAIPSRSPQRYKNMFEGHGEVEFVSWDAESPGELAAIISGSDAVVNLVGENIAAGRWTEELKARLRDSRVRVGQALLKAVEQADAPPKVLVQGSAIGYYGQRGDEALDETSAPPAVGKSFLADLAREWEASTEAVEAMGVRRVVVRTGVVLDAEGGALEKFLTPFRMYLGGPMGSGRQWMSWIHRRDEVGGIVQCIERDSCGGAYNFTAPTAVTNRDFCKILGRVMHRPCWLPAPGPALKLLLGEMAEELILGGQRVLPTRLEQSGYTFLFSDLKEALHDIVQRLT